MAKRLDILLTARHPDFSRSRIKGLIEAGFVKVNGIVTYKAGRKVSENDIIEVEIPPPVPAEPEPEDIPIVVIYEDDDLLVIDKPPGIVVHPAPGHQTGTLVNALLHHCPGISEVGGRARPGIVHRLDQDTSGVMTVAKSAKAQLALAKAFASHDGVEKTYLAIVHGAPNPQAGRVENKIGRSPFDRKKMAIVETNGKAAITEYRTLSRCGALSCVECRILTGRTHQIRVHMASLGCPVAGDKVYGNTKRDGLLSPPPQRQLLHAWRLKLPHPATGEPMSFEAPLPSDWPPQFGRPVN